MPDEPKPTQDLIDPNQSKVDKLLSGLFFTFITSVGILSGFGYSLSVTKKQDSKSYLKGIQPNLFEVHESGAGLARRALLRATLYSVTGFSLFCVGVWKLSGASNFEEFRYTVGSLLPRITKPPSEQQGRTEFKSLTDFMQYLVDEDNKKKKRKE